MQIANVNNFETMLVIAPGFVSSHIAMDLILVSWIQWIGNKGCMENLFDIEVLVVYHFVERDSCLLIIQSCFLSTTVSSIRNLDKFQFPSLWFPKSKFWTFYTFYYSTHFTLLVCIYTPWKHQKTSGFLMFSGGIERDQWYEKS